MTNTTVEIIVPENVIGCVYGENGSNLARLRQVLHASLDINLFCFSKAIVSNFDMVGVCRTILSGLQIALVQGSLPHCSKIYCFILPEQCAFIYHPSYTMTIIVYFLPLRSAKRE